MTVISKSIGDKKSDNLKEPLVENIVVEPNDEVRKSDVEAGGYPIPPPHAARYIISARVRPYYSLMFIIMLVLLVATSLLGIFGVDYLYAQYRSLVGAEKTNVLSVAGTLSIYEDPSALPYEKKVPAVFEKIEPSKTNGINSYLLQGYFNSDTNSVINSDNSEGQKNELKEEFELDLGEDRYEKINVPAKGNSRFVHDFYSNYTAIVDVENGRCFIMPLDRSLILPPKSLYDLLFKMSDGYYSMDTEKIRRDMQVLMPAITDYDSLGDYIKKECETYPTYKLEKFVGGVTGN